MTTKRQLVNFCTN